MKIANIGTNTRGRTLLLVAGTVAVTLALTFAALFAAGVLAPMSRQAEVAAPGANVMPFDLDKTQHIFSQLPDGGQIRYTTSDSALVTALHHWFRAQVSDHGSHATEQ